MEEAKHDEIENDLKELCRKHRIAGASFVGTTEDEFVGLFSVDNPKITHCMDAMLNIGRLWQHVRSTMKKALDQFEGKW